MNEKLSKDRLIGKLEELEKLRFVGDKLSLFEHNHHKALSFKQSKTLNIIYKEIWEYSHQIGELRQLIEAQAEPSEAEVGEFIGEQAHLFKRQWPDRFYGDGSIDFYVFDNLKKVLKAYDELRRA